MALADELKAGLRDASDLGALVTHMPDVQGVIADGVDGVLEEVLVCAVFNVDDVLSAVRVDIVVAGDGAAAEVVAAAEEALEAGHEEGSEGEDAEGDEEVGEEVDGGNGGAVGEEAELEGLEEWAETLERGCEVAEE